MIDDDLTFEGLRDEYDRLFDSCVIRPEYASAAASRARQIAVDVARYSDVMRETGVPWFVVGIIHSLESSLNFACHLHNGDPLTARTVHVPKGRPLDGDPPFSWAESAIDALRLERFDVWSPWTAAGIAFKLESYNGFGYRRFHDEVLSPYLWSFSTHYTAGKYMADGRWSATEVSSECGGMVLLRALSNIGVVRVGADRVLVG